MICGHQLATNVHENDESGLCDSKCFRISHISSSFNPSKLAKQNIASLYHIFYLD